MKKISVVIPAYNEEQYIGKSLRALARQTFNRADIEIIVVDNASTDNTTLVARESGADLVISEPYRGTNRARQTGLAQSCGEIVAFLDADCEPPYWWLEKIYEKLHQNKGSFVALGGTYRFTSKPTESLFLFETFYSWVVLPTLNSVMGRLFKRGGVIIGGNFAAFRQKFEQAGGFDISYTFFGDDASIARGLGELGTVHFDPSLYVYSSTRRFEREGLIKTNWEYAKNYFKVMLK